MLENISLEYVWLDGYNTPNLRSKTKIIKTWDGTLEGLPAWNFDGSSTRQATGSNSECLLQPVRLYRRAGGIRLVLCEVLNVDGTPHASNSRAGLRNFQSIFDSAQYWWGFEQEYFITKNRRPLGFPTMAYPAPQGPYYCGVGGDQVKGRHLVEEHLHLCGDMEITLAGVNAEVAIGQWEYQCFSTDTLKACDDLWMSRYMLYRLSEKYDYGIDLTPKPMAGDWNGSGCHTNFSTEYMRSVGGRNYFVELFKSFDIRHTVHIAGYGEDNDQRLTGAHETQHIETFSWGVGDRSASMRVPTSTAHNEWQGYIEDRRPASNCDPYVVTKLIIETTSTLGNF